MQDTSDSLAYGNSQLSFGNVGGLATFTLDLINPVDAIDDVAPTACKLTVLDQVQTTMT